MKNNTKFFCDNKQTLLSAPFKTTQKKKPEVNKNK